MSFSLERLNQFLLKASQDGDLAMIRYVLTAPELKQHADIHCQNDSVFTIACTHGYMDIIRYVLTSPELSEHCDIHAINDLGLKWTILFEHFDIAWWLLTSPELKEHANPMSDPWVIIKECFKNKNYDFVFNLAQRHSFFASFWIKEQKRIIERFGTPWDTLIRLLQQRDALKLDPNNFDHEKIFAQALENKNNLLIEEFIDWYYHTEPALFQQRYHDAIQCWLQNNHVEIVARIFKKYPDNTYYVEEESLYV